MKTRSGARVSCNFHDDIFSDNFLVQVRQSQSLVLSFFITVLEALPPQE